MTLTSRLGLPRMRPRDPDEAHRAASPLELFFDLVFVVAVSIAAAELHHAEADDHIASGVGAYLMVFFAIWWAWMNFTWFASAFDTDDWLYRILTITQMAGVLVLAAGTRAAMTDADFTLVTIGYVIMRLALVVQWIRASLSHPDLRRTALRYAAGIAIVQVLWVARLALPEQLGLASFLALVAAELAVPVVAERARPTPWHPGHVAERYGLFTLILLGESILASTNAIIDGLEHAEHAAPLVLIAACGLVLAASMWWIYFARDHADAIRDLRGSLTFGYAHYVVFAAAGAFSAGIEVAIDHATDAADLDAATAAATLTIPVAIFAIGVWALTLRVHLSQRANIACVLLAAVVGGAALVPFSLPIATLAMVAITVIVTRGSMSNLAPTR